MVNLNKVVVIAVGVILVGVMSSTVLLGSAEETETMELSNNLPAGALPPIDLSASAETETATFALG